MPNYNIKVNSKQLTYSLMQLYYPYVCLNDDLSVNLKQNTYYYTEKNGSPGDELQNIENIIYNTTYVEEGYFALHASAVCYGSNAFLLTGHTGSGKSTLTAWLCSNGFTYLSDDISIINISTLKVIPMKNMIMLREGGANVLISEGVDLSGCKIIDCGNIQRYAYKPEKLPSSCKSYDIGGVINIKRTDGSCGSGSGSGASGRYGSGSGSGASNAMCSRKSREKAFLTVLNNAYVYKKAEKEYYSLIMKIADKGCYDLTYYQMDYVASVITSIYNNLNSIELNSNASNNKKINSI